MKRHPALPYLLIVLLGALLFIPFLGSVHLFDWDEINFAESAREMIVTGDYSRVQINFQPFWEKPPLFIWLQVLCMKMFGVGEFAARLPNALCGIATLLILFYTGKRYFDERLGLLWVLAYVGSFLPHFYFKSGIIDPVFNLFIFLAVLQLVKLTTEAFVKPAILAGLFTGLAVLTKGPVGLLIVMLSWVCYAIIKRDKSSLKLKYLGLFFLTAFLASFMWYGIETIRNGPWFLQEFIEYQIRLLTTGDSSHGEPFYYHFVVLAIGCFPVSILAFLAWRKRAADTLQQQALRLWMIVLFTVVLLLFSIVKTKIVHYTSLCYIPLTFLAAYGIYSIDKEKIKISKQVLFALGFMGFVVSFSLAALPFIMANTGWLIAHVNDDFAKANLGAGVYWPLALCLIGAAYFLALGYSFYLLSRSQSFKGILTLFVATMLLIQWLFFTLVPRVEVYSQRPAIEFFKSLAGKDVYVEVLGYKSYAHLYYSNKLPEATQSVLFQQYIDDNWDDNLTPDASTISWLEKEWHLKGEIDKPVYFCCKISKAAQYRQMPQLKEIGVKNGFVFFFRHPEMKEK